MFEPALIIDETNVEKIELNNRGKRKRQAPPKSASSYRCEEDFNAIDCSLRAQKFTGQLQSEHDYCPGKSIRGISPPPKLQKEIEVASTNIVIPVDAKPVKNKVACKQCANRVTNIFPTLSTVIDHQEIVTRSDQASTSGGAFFIPVREPLTVVCLCEENKPKEKELEVILPAPRKKLSEKCTTELFEKSMTSLKDKMKRKAGDSALALKYIDQIKVEGSDYYPNCKICYKVFSNATNLIVHYRSHAGIKPFTCKLCSASFTRRQSLQYHEMCHNDQSLYTCSKCQATFRHRSHYKDHLRKHSDDNAFGCEYCSQRFGSRSTLRRHVIKYHESYSY